MSFKDVLLTKYNPTKCSEQSKVSYQCNSQKTFNRFRGLFTVLNTRQYSDEGLFDLALSS